ANAGPVRRMQRRAARWSGYNAAPSYSSGVFVSPPVTPPPPPAMPPYALFGAIGRFAPPPYFFFSGTVRPGFGPPWAGSVEGSAASRPPADEPPPAPSTANEAQSEPQISEQVSDQAFVAGLYRDILGREPDEPGLTAWIHALHRGMTRRAVTNYFLNSRERARPEPMQTRGPVRPLRKPLPADIDASDTADSADDELDRTGPTARSLAVPEVIPQAEQPPIADEDGEVLPEEVPVPPADAPPTREREF
ncbi:MAG TPA: DUF4214 domain-containing protein, partial [Pirellulales bacterium]|nr:DUF4214 domain-containing protein [Pirellulales bacterium]